MDVAGNDHFKPQASRKICCPRQHLLFSGEFQCFIETAFSSVGIVA